MGQKRTRTLTYTYSIKKISINCLQLRYEFCYFICRIPNSGSFIRITKADLGISCPDAIRIKYGKDEYSSIVPNYVNLPQKSGASRQVEMVGMEKIKGKQR